MSDNDEEVKENLVELFGKLLYIAIEHKYMSSLLGDDNFSDEEKKTLNHLYKQFKFYKTLTDELPKKQEIKLKNYGSIYDWSLEKDRNYYNYRIDIEKSRKTNPFIDYNKKDAELTKLIKEITDRLDEKDKK